MSRRTIANIGAFVIWLPLVLAGLTSCGIVTSSIGRKQPSRDYLPPRVVGRIANTDITESSGLAASKCQTDVFWTHNDSGDDAFIFAFNSKGENLGTWRVRNASNDDWEDLATFRDPSAKCFVYIGEIGNNSQKRNVRTIYRVAEPQASAESKDTTRKNALETGPAESLSYTSDDIKLDAETLMVHPATGAIYVLTKSREKPSFVYRIDPVFGSGEIMRAVRIAEIKVPSIPFGLLTGGDISSDGRRVVLCDYSNGYELTLPANDQSFDDIWKQQPIEIDLGDRDTGEAVAYSPDGNTIYASTEGKNAPLIEVRRKVN